MTNILIAEDDLELRTTLKNLLLCNDYNVCETDCLATAGNLFNLPQFRVIVSKLPKRQSDITLVKNLVSNIPLLLLVEDGEDLSSFQGYPQLAKPVNPDQLLTAIRDMLERGSGNAEPAGCTPVNNMIGSCAEMLKLYDHIHKVAPTTATVLINGETGTGKELVARAIHNESRRSDQKLICVNCAAIPDTLIESELFGYEKGAFTGAATTRKGLIEAADGGTLFLDEIGELPIEAQARLLRFIQEGEIRSIGSTTARRVNVRLVAATHRDLRALCLEGRFREDLFYRINVIQLNLPPLRERGEDILAIANALLQQTCERFGKSVKHFSNAAIRSIARYSWPGNVRELENAVERAVILSEASEIPVDLLAVEIPDIEHNTQAQPAPEPTTAPQDAEETRDNLSLEDYFQRFVLENQDQMSETELAQKLGISRKCLWERRQRFGIPRRKTPTNNKSASSPLSRG
jgi:DNA-binding NtrC family response regulator